MKTCNLFLTKKRKLFFLVCFVGSLFYVRFLFDPKLKLVHNKGDHVLQQSVNASSFQAEVVFPNLRPHQQPSNTSAFEASPVSASYSRSQSIHIAIVICKSDDRRQWKKQTVLLSILLRSIVLLSSSHFQVHLVVDSPATFDLLLTSIQKWSISYKNRLQMTRVLVSYPQGYQQEFNKICHLCAMARLFLVDLLPEVRRVIYIDSDFIVLRPFHQLWDKFRNFKKENVFGIGEYANKGYERHSIRQKFPRAKSRRHNAGLLMMDLEKMRSLRPSWVQRILKIYEDYGGHQGRLRYCDQDILNIYLRVFHNSHYVVPCNWNYRQYLCQSRKCQEISEDGIAAVHGIGGGFFKASMSVRGIFTTLRDAHGSESELRERLMDASYTSQKRVCKKLTKKDHNVLFDKFRSAIRQSLFLS